METCRKIAREKREQVTSKQKIKAELRRRKQKLEAEAANRAKEEAYEQQVQEKTARATAAAALNAAMDPSVAKQKAKDELFRSLRALESRLEAKAAAKNIQVPKLCNCDHAKTSHSTTPVWERCANNCKFFNNPQAYARALSDVFRSLK